MRIFSPLLYKLSYLAIYRARKPSCNNRGWKPLPQSREPGTRPAGGEAIKGVTPGTTLVANKTRHMA